MTSAMSKFNDLASATSFPVRRLAQDRVYKWDRFQASFFAMVSSYAILGNASGNTRIAFCPSRFALARMMRSTVSRHLLVGATGSPKIESCELDWFDGFWSGTA